MRDDVEAPLLEVGDFVLRLADDDFNERLLKPSRLGQQAVALSMELLATVLVRRGSDGTQLRLSLGTHRDSLGLPCGLDQHQHAGAGDLVQCRKRSNK